MANQDLFRRSYERMNLAELDAHSDSLKESIAAERLDLVRYGIRNVERLADTTGWYRYAERTAPVATSSTWSSTLSPSTKGRVLNKAKELSRNHIRSIEMRWPIEGKQLRQHRHDIEWHRKYILALGCMVLFLVGSSLAPWLGEVVWAYPRCLPLGFSSSTIPSRWWVKNGQSRLIDAVVRHVAGYAGTVASRFALALEHHH